MLEQEKKKKKKQKVKYSVLFVPDVATADVKRFPISLRLVFAICFIVVVLISVSFVYCYYLTNHITVANASINSLNVKIEEIGKEKQTLVEQNEELQEKLTLLSETLNEKVREEEERIEEEAKKFLPTGFPIQGHSSYNEELTSHDDEPAAVFIADVGASVVATAKGKVSSIEGNDTAGYIVMINHENGYFSVYRNGSLPTVTVGAEVSNTTELFSVTTGHEELIYQVILNGKYIDPLGLMEIYG